MGRWDDLTFLAQQRMLSIDTIRSLTMAYNKSRWALCSATCLLLHMGSASSSSFLPRSMVYDGSCVAALRGGSSSTTIQRKSDLDRGWPPWYPKGKPSKKDLSEDILIEKDVTINNNSSKTTSSEANIEIGEVISVPASDDNDVPVEVVLPDGESITLEADSEGKLPEVSVTSNENISTPSVTQSTTELSKGGSPKAKRVYFWNRKQERSTEQKASTPASATSTESVKPISDKPLEQEIRSDYLDTSHLTSGSTSDDPPKESQQGVTIESDATTSSSQTIPAEASTIKSNATSSENNAKTRTNGANSIPDFGPNVIVMNAPISPYRMYQRTSPGSTSNGVPPSRAAQPVSSSSVILLVEILASVLGTASRLFILSWLTRRIATHQEMIHPVQHFVWESLNDRFARDAVVLQSTLRSPPFGISVRLWKRQHIRKQAKRKANKQALHNIYNRTAVVLEVSGDSKGGLDVEYLADIVSFLLQQHRECAFGVHKETGEAKELEVILAINSPGGSVSSYGLAAAQIQRLRAEPGIVTTSCVDKYAASGGYMIASQTHTIVAAPFATVGSIGVIVEGLNFHEVARRYGVLPMVIKAGDAKNPLSTFGPVTAQDLENEQYRVAKVHEMFRELVQSGRPMVEDLNLVANGDIFMGQEALDLKLVDRVMTSSEYILDRIRAGDRVLKLHRTNPTRYSRRPSLTPLDILPHLRTWLPRDNAAWMSRLVQAGTAWEFARYLMAQHFKHR
jgi:signal peptide peptidase SppA